MRRECAFSQLSSCRAFKAARLVNMSANDEGDVRAERAQFRNLESDLFCLH